ncbi:MAG: hypothetical protein Q9175_003205 [Cornicularia normoerica]
MPLFSGTTETISTVPEKELSSIDQIDIFAFRRALLKKPTYKAYKALLVHRRAIQCLKTNVDLMVKEADDALYKASENSRKTKALANDCDSTMSPSALTCPPIAGKVLQSIIELQTFYLDEREGVLIECVFEQGRALALLQEVNKKVEKVEHALVKKYGIHTVDDEGDPLDMRNVERIIDVMASTPGSRIYRG